MGYQVLLTIDLPGANDQQRKIFYDELAKIKSLKKVKNLTIAWSFSCADNVERKDIIDGIILFIKSAKGKSEIEKVEYAMQLDKSDVIISTL